MKKLMLFAVVFFTIIVCVVSHGIVFAADVEMPTGEEASITAADKVKETRDIVSEAIHEAQEGNLQGRDLAEKAHEAIKARKEEKEQIKSEQKEKVEKEVKTDKEKEAKSEKYSKKESNECVKFEKCSKKETEKCAKKDKTKKKGSGRRKF